jgi:hypothetical protein
MLNHAKGSNDLSGAKPKKIYNGWSKEQEILLAKWSDYCSCYRWLHDRAEKKLSKNNNLITIPVIILSTVTGTASVGLTGLVGDIPNGQKYGQIVIGLVSLFTGILTTLGNFFRYAQNSESHRVAAVSWGKFNRLISVELAQHPEDRSDSLEFLAICRQDLDRLIEQSPQIPDDIINVFNNTFIKQGELQRPDILNSIEHTSVYNNNKEKLKMMVTELAMNIKHKKRLMREEIIPDLDVRMKRLIEESIQEYDKKTKNKDKTSDYLSDVRKKISEVVDSIQDIHISDAKENTVVNF